MDNYKSIYDVSIFIVTEDVQVIYSKEYDYTQDSSYVFIMLTNDVLNPDYGEDNTICIHKDYMDWKYMPNIPDEVFEMRSMQRTTYNDKKRNKFIWQADFNRIPGAEYMEELSDYKCVNDFNGYMHTKNIIQNAGLLLHEHNTIDDTIQIKKAGLFPQKGQIRYRFAKLKIKEQMFPAVFVAYNALVQYNGMDMHGFLPAVGQLKMLSEYQNRINIILEDTLKQNQRLKVRSILENNIEYAEWWSSSQIDECAAVYITGSGGTLGQFNKIVDSKCVLPIFTLK